MRCAACGARNADGAGFCTQCFTSFTPVDRASQDAATAASRRAEVALLDHAADPRTAEPAEPATDARFRRRGDEVDWRCGVCGEWNALVATECSACLQPFATTMGADDRPEPAREVSDEATLIATMLLPGIGHVLHGRVGTGVARAGLFAAWALGGLALLRAAVTAAQPRLPAVVLLVAALAIWAGSLLDAHALTRGSGVELLRPRVLLWLVVAVIGALLATFTISALSLPAA